jgi:ferredoxin
MKKEKPRAQVKFNSGMLAMLCSACRVIIKTGEDFTKEEVEYTLSKGLYLPPQFCEKCKTKQDESSPSSQHF